MYNPLALALESMRGRQSLRFKGTVCLQDVWMDDTGDVYMCVDVLFTMGVMPDGLTVLLWLVVGIYTRLRR